MMSEHHVACARNKLHAQSQLQSQVPCMNDQSGVVAALEIPPSWRNTQKKKIKKIHVCVVWFSRNQCISVSFKCRYGVLQHGIVGKRSSPYEIEAVMTLLYIYIIIQIIQNHNISPVIWSCISGYAIRNVAISYHFHGLVLVQLSSFLKHVGIVR